MPTEEVKSQPPASSEVRIGRHPHVPGSWLLETEQWFPKDPDSVFAFFADAGNLETITPPWLQFRIVTPQPIEMHQGALIDYRLRLHGLPFGWQTKITAWEPSRRFIDEQVRGPYRCWIHEHTFEPSETGTLVRDWVTYRAIGGVLVQKLLVERDLRTIFEFRRERLKGLLGS